MEFIVPLKRTTLHLLSGRAVSPWQTVHLESPAPAMSAAAALHTRTVGLNLSSAVLVFGSESSLIERFIEKHGFSDKDHARKLITEMADGKDKARFLNHTLPDLIRTAKDALKEQVRCRLAAIEHRDFDEAVNAELSLEEPLYLTATLEHLNDLGNIFEESVKGMEPADSEISARIFGLGKHDLYRVMQENPEGFRTLFNPVLKEIASAFCTRAAFTCRLMLLSMFEMPGYMEDLAEIASNDTASAARNWTYKKSGKEMSREIKSGLRKVFLTVVNAPEYKLKDAETRQEQLFNAEVDFLRKYFYAGLVRVAAIYLREQIGYCWDGQPVSSDRRGLTFGGKLADIHDEMATLSETLLTGIYDVAGRRAEEIYGKPIVELTLPPRLNGEFKTQLKAHTTKMRREEDKLVKLASVRAVPDETARFQRLFDLVKIFGDEFKAIPIVDSHRRDPNKVPEELAQSIWAKTTPAEANAFSAAYNELKARPSMRVRSGSAAITSPRKHVSSSPQRAFANYLYGVYRTMVRPCFALVLGGAGAQRKFPTFDYDTIGIKESDNGKTSKGFDNATYFQKLYELIGDTMSRIDHNFDPNVSVVGNEVATLERFMTELDKRDTHSFFSARGYLTLAYGSGARYLAQSAIAGMHKFTGEPANARILEALYRYDHEMTVLAKKISRRDGGKKRINIKTDAGGIRDVDRLVWVMQLITGKFNASVPEMLQEIKSRFSPDKADQLIRSYNFVTNIRIRLDLAYGRNSKYLPEGEALETFSKALGYLPDNGSGAAGRLLKDLEQHMSIIETTVGEYISYLVDRQGMAQQVLDQLNGPFTLERLDPANLLPNLEAN
ncbi:MAG TPA: hypothetical protein VMD02_07610, partial [Candidatus Omnitrophota bacterium]|nr:hypothetical protein [Candidatus Omnitrophota bacterium]